MGYRDLLVSVDSSAAGAARVKFAAALAARHDAHLVGLYLVPPPEAPRHFQSALLEEAFRQAAVEAREAEAKVRLTFDDVVGKQNVRAEWRTVTGFAHEELALHVRYADLAVIGQTDPASAAKSATPQARPEDVAFSSGRPVLIVPYIGASAERVSGHALVAWNASREAARAVNDAMPLLKAAKAVTVMVVNPKRGVSGHGAEPGADIAVHLARHGVRAEVKQETSEIPVGDALLSRAADLDVDLIVMGAYGHSRLREMLLGGATRELLQHMTVPVLMSH